LIVKLGIPSNIFPEIVPPGTNLGRYEGIDVIAPACHDTGSAVAAVPAQTPDFAYISSGTWSLVGLEIDRPILTREALKANVTNEGGVYNTFRLLKNVMGLWILQQCRATWEAEGDAYTYTELVDMAIQSEPFTAIINPNDPVFLSPGDHPQRIRESCRRTDQPIPETPGRIVRCILESLALAYRDVLELAKSVSDRQVSVLHIVGGGAQNHLLNQMTANATGLPVIAGPVEATVIGNAIVQLITLGEITDLNQARQIVNNLAELKRYEPEENANSQSSSWEDAYAYFQSHYSMIDDID